MSLCPEREERAAMSDAEYWEHVLPPHCHPIYDDGPDLDQTTNQTEPCPECGEHGACAWDTEGRPLIHSIRAEDRPA